MNIIIRIEINYLSRDLIFVGYHADYKEYG